MKEQQQLRCCANLSDSQRVRKEDAHLFGCGSEAGASAPEGCKRASRRARRHTSTRIFEGWKFAMAPCLPVKEIWHRIPPRRGAHQSLEC
eukprot:6196552-Pleurochrysis_carterae.AAC.2